MTRKLTLIQDEDTGFWYIAECTGFSYISISNQATTKLIVSPEDKKYAWNLYAIPEVHSRIYKQCHKKWLGEAKTK
jgi:hypothetical protein